MWTHLLFLITVSIVCGLTDAGYCTVSYSCTGHCSTTHRYTTSCWLIATCVKYRTIYKSCSHTCYKKQCCDGYGGTHCEEPICFGSTSCPNGGRCASPNNCECPVGFSEPYCTDRNECILGTSECNHICDNTIGSYQCLCYNDGYYLVGHTCYDRDECTEGTATCDTNMECINTVGSYSCSCITGYAFDEFNICHDIDECNDGLSGCSKGCNNVEGSFLCTCPSGFFLSENRRTCEDIDECAMLNGGCQDNCTNIEGSFLCSCFEERILQDDGQSCTGADDGITVFEKYFIPRQLLPIPCFEVFLTGCSVGRELEIKLLSTSEWYTSLTDPSVFYTLGISFVKINSFTMPVSLQGIEVLLRENSFELLHTVTSSDGITKVSNLTTPECNAFTFLSSDMFDFISADSFSKTLIWSLSSQLPSWFELGKSDHSTIAVQDMKSDLIYGRDIDELVECTGVPAIDSHLYSVFRFDTGFSLKILGNEIDFPSLLEARKFCIIVDMCSSSGGTIFLMIPEESRDLLIELPMFKSLQNDLNILIKPRGIGVSFVGGIKVDKSPISMWNGYQMFQYPVMEYADLWIECDFEKTDRQLTIQGSADIFFDIPSVETIVTSVFRDEWNGLIDLHVSVSPIFRFRLFGKDYEITFPLAIADVDVYISTGGPNHNWCDKNDNPAGLYFSLLLEVNPFTDVPILGDWLFSKNRLHGFFSKDSQQMSATVQHFSDEIFEISYLVNSTLPIITTSFTDLENNALTSLLQNITNDLRLIQDIVDIDLNNSWISEDINTIISTIERLLEISIDVKYSLKQFIDEVEFIGSPTTEDLVNTLNAAIGHIQIYITNTFNSITDSIVKGIGEYKHYGFKYSTDIEIFGLEIGSFDIEIVFTDGDAFQCSRYDKIVEFLNGENAIRFIGKALITKKLGYFLGLKGDSRIGGAIAENSNKVILQLESSVRMLGISIPVDVFITSGGGIYFYLEGNVWDVFLVQVDVVAELEEEWYDLTFVLEGRFIAKPGESDTSFQDSYVDALKKVVGMISDDAQKRLTGVQNSLTKAQDRLTKAQNWLEERKDDLRKANSVFDNAISSLENAKQAVENARGPFETAMKELKAAQKSVDSLCKIKDCAKICIPGISCKICHKNIFGLEVPYPCCKFVDCMIRTPDPICVFANDACWLLRAAAYIVLEAAVSFLSKIMVPFDIAQAALTAAQTVVDTSRVALKAAEGILTMAQDGMEYAKGIMKAAKIGLEAVKRVIGAAANVLELVLEYGLKSLLDVRNCGFRLEMSTTDLPVFDVSCEVNALRIGWQKVQITINFKNIVQSIWQAARTTITELMNTLGNAIGRKRRDIEFEATSKLHRLLRIIRQTDDSEDSFLNDAIDITKSSNAFNMSDDYDAADRMHNYQEKCQTIEKLQDFLQSAFNTLQDTLIDSLAYQDNVNSVKDELLQYNATGTIADNITAEDVGVSKTYAQEHYNMTSEDIDKAIEDTKSGFDDNPIILELKHAANASLKIVESEVNSIESVDFVNIWYTAMNNLTKNYFGETECNDFRDCMFYTISSFYVLYEAEDFPNASAVRTSILDLESIVIESFQNETLTITDTASSMEFIVNEIDQITEMNPFCSEAPTINYHPKNVTALLGTNATFNCTAIGNPDPLYSWYKNDVLVPEERTGTITVNNITEGDHGTKFNCVAGNIVANITSRDAFLLTTNYDVDECETNNGDCEHGCLNIVGSYECTCPDGYMINETDGHSCLDTDECQEAFLELRCEHVCNNFIGGYNCSCDDGYSLNNDGHSCSDTDECKIANGGCDNQCMNYDGSYQCICYEGYIGSGNIGQCTDQNECETDNGECEQNCTNTDGSFFCTCRTGYLLDTDGEHCNDIDECEEDNAGCEHICVNTAGSYNCTCSSGYVLEEDFHQCTDIDECEINNGDCEQQCINTFGSLMCCDEGFILDAYGFECIDIDECSVANGNCSQTCINAPSSFACGCYEGYDLAKDGYQCVDNNECEANTPICEHDCTNTDGSFTCSCIDGYTLANDGRNCVDINECSVENGGCEYECMNEPGTHTCLCPLGYILADDGFRCFDFKECYENNGGCEQICTDNDGSFACKCREGFVLDVDGFKCNDIDECSIENGGCAQNCINTLGSFTCTCNEGFVLAEEGFTCKDVDECSTDNGGCDHICDNTGGSFTCACNEGFILEEDGFTCKDVDECSRDNGMCDQNCINTHGSFTCSCNEGFGLVNDGTTCTDVNECEEAKGGCSHRCENIMGSYQCLCDVGYSLNDDKLLCDDIDECKVKNGGCHQKCVNTNGSFHCACKRGFNLHKFGTFCLEHMQKLMETSVTMNIVLTDRQKRSNDLRWNAIQQSLDEFYTKYTSKGVKTYVQSVTTFKTKVEVDFTIVYDESDAAVLAIATMDISLGTQLNYEGTPVASRSYLPANVTNACDVLETLMDGCEDGQRCEMTADGPSCLMEEDSSGLNYLLIIIPTTGVFILCLMVVFIAFSVSLIRKQRKKRNKRKRAALQRQSGLFPKAPAVMIPRAKLGNWKYGESPHKC